MVDWLLSGGVLVVVIDAVEKLPGLLNPSLARRSSW